MTLQSRVSREPSPKKLWWLLEVLLCPLPRRMTPMAVLSVAVPLPPQMRRPTVVPEVHRPLP